MIGADFKRMLRIAATVVCAGALLLVNMTGAVAAQTDKEAKEAPPKTAMETPPDTGTEAPSDTGTEAPADTGMVMPGGEEGTVFKDLVVKGEDLIRIEFERPELNIDVDPQSAPGLEWGSIQEILDRNRPDLTSPLFGFFAYNHFSFHARPWLDKFSSGDIVRFRPSVRDVNRWQLTVANSRGETVASFGDNGKPPEEIGWNGLSSDGEPATPGLTYSYVLEAYDKAGNKRSFVGEGFELPPYRLESKKEVVMLFSGIELSSSESRASAGPSVPAPILLEVADRINQSEKVDQPIQVQATARSFEKANMLAESIVEALNPLVLGGKARIQPFTKVQADAPNDGTIQVVVPR
jgi:hypothetical protein